MARSTSAPSPRSRPGCRGPTAHFTDTPEKVAAITGRLFDALERRVLRPEIGARYPLREAAAAHRALEAGETTGSTILLPDGPSSPT